jgi:hypothetical protein
MRDEISPDWHRERLDLRQEAHRADPGVSRPWSEVKAEILRAPVKRRSN